MFVILKSIHFIIVIPYLHLFECHLFGKLSSMFIHLSVNLVVQPLSLLVIYLRVLLQNLAVLMQTLISDFKRIRSVQFSDKIYNSLLFVFYIFLSTVWGLLLRLRLYWKRDLGRLLILLVYFLQLLLVSPLCLFLFLLLSENFDLLLTF